MFILFCLVVVALLFGMWGEPPVLGGFLGLLLGWVYGLSQRVKSLEAQVQRQAPHELASPAMQVAPPPIHSDEEAAGEPSLAVATATTGAEPLGIISEPIPTREPVPENLAVSTSHSLPVPASEPGLFAKALTTAQAWLFGGNPFVRAGVVLLFFGVVFLLRYSLEHNLVPVELRLLGAAGAALVLLVFGWRLRQRQGAYGLILQAGGVGLLYLTVFGAFGLYQLIPSLPAFALLVVIVAGAVMLAILQNSLPLAAFATVGGFLAPLLTSSGSNNYIGLFGFYALLNAGIVAVAWFKSWRLLNWLGFVFTFVIASVWGWLSYQPENFATLEPFLILFFLFYVAIAVLFATRTPVSFKDKVDSTLIFGTPLVGFGMQVALVQQFEYGIAISSVVLGGFYLLLATGLWKRYGRQQQLLVETFLALGVVFATLAIPFAVDGALTSAAWAIEGAGILWVSIRQQQLWRRIVAVLLQYAALIALVVALFLRASEWHGSLSGQWAFANGHFIALVLVTGAMLLSSRLLSAEFAGKRGFEGVLAIILLYTALLFQWLGFLWQIIEFDLFEQVTRLHLLYAAVVAGLLGLASWMPRWDLLRLVFPLLMFLLGTALFTLVTLSGSGFADGGWLCWPLAVGLSYATLYRYQVLGWFAGWLKVMQAVLLWLLVLWFTHEVAWQMGQYFASSNGWYWASLPLAALAALWWLMVGKVWPVRAYQTVLMPAVGLPLVVLLGAWGFLALQTSGDSSPLPWLPLLNPLDVVMAGVALTLFSLYRQQFAHQPTREFGDVKMLLRYSGLVLGFIWLNVLALRVLHHFYGLAWAFPRLLTAPVTQTVLAIVWTLVGMLLAWRGNRVGQRNLWIAGAVLLGAVVLKLFLVDFASSGTLARVISFISVGVLLLFIGYLAPMPPADKENGHV